MWKVGYLSRWSRIAQWKLTWEGNMKVAGRTGGGQMAARIDLKLVLAAHFLQSQPLEQTSRTETGT